MDTKEVLGSANNEECKIDSIAQSWSVISNAGENSKKYIAMESLENYLVNREAGIIKLLDPPFEKGLLEPGYIKSYLPGVRENGGQYTHAAVWTALGFFAGEENDKGAEILFAINPAVHGADEELAKQYKVEPYVLAGDVYANPAHMGRGGWSWYTGSAAWYRKVAMEVLCGYTERQDGFSLCPHMSAHFSEFSLTVSKAETEYRITVCMGKKFLSVDGVPIAVHDMKTYQFPFDGGRHEVIFHVEPEQEK